MNVVMLSTLFTYIFIRKLSVASRLSLQVISSVVCKIEKCQRFLLAVLGKALPLTFHEPHSLFLRNEVDVVEFFIESDDVPHQVKVFHWNLVISAVYLTIFIQYNFSLA